DQGWLMGLFTAGARLGYRTATGLSLAALRPIDQLDGMQAKILLVYGEHELTLPGARDAAEQNPAITLWEVPGATHGSYVASVGADVYAGQVVSFYDAHLLR
ncbi:MAG: hypothetical protein JXN59_08340, partial [Anaerolineae bacterium]|nr:hypothetical protein [Anaerolineae bacterium]